MLISELKVQLVCSHYRIIRCLQTICCGYGYFVKSTKVSQCVVGVTREIKYHFPRKRAHRSVPPRNIRSDQLTSPRLCYLGRSRLTLGRRGREGSGRPGPPCVCPRVCRCVPTFHDACVPRGSTTARKESDGGERVGDEARHSRVVRFHVSTRGVTAASAAACIDSALASHDYSLSLCLSLSPRLGRLVPKRKGGRQSRTVVVDVDDDQSNRPD